MKCAQWVVYNELFKTANLYFRIVTVVKGDLLSELARAYVNISFFLEGRMSAELEYIYSTFLGCEIVC